MGGACDKAEKQFPVTDVEAAQWRYRSCLVATFVSPAVCCVGFLLNLLCIIIFCAYPSHKRATIVPYLIALCVFDALQLLLSVFVLVLPAIQEYQEIPHLSTLGQLNFLSTGLLSPLLMASNFGGIWTITLISIQRYRAICHPLATRVRGSNQVHNKLQFIALAIVVLLLNGVKYAEFEWSFEEDPETNITYLVHNPSALLHDDTYRLVSNMLVYPLLIYILPLVVLIVLNTKIVLTIYEARRLMPTHFDSKRNHKQQREHRSAFMIITIIILFFSCHTGGLAIRFVNFEMHQDSNWFIFTKDVINVLFNVNSSANPLVYFVFTRHFKDLRLSWTAMSWHGHGQGHGHSHTLHRSNRSYTAESLSLRSPLHAARIRQERHTISLNEDNGDEQRMATKVHLRRMSTASSHTPNPSLMYSSSLLGARRKESSMRGTSPLVHTTSLSPPSTPLKQPCAMGSKRLLQHRSKTSHARLEWSADVIRHADEYC